MLPIDIVVDPSWRMVQFYHIRERHWPPVAALRQFLPAVRAVSLYRLLKNRRRSLLLRTMKI